MELKAKHVISGTWGSVWLNGGLMPAVFGLQVKVAKSKDKVHLAGRMMVGHKALNAEGTGSLRLHHADSAMLKLAARTIRNGLTEDNTLVTKLADPDALGAERIAIYGVDFDDGILADWEVGALGKRECPFTFDHFELLDAIEEVT